MKKLSIPRFAYVLVLTASLSPALGLAAPATAATFTQKVLAPDGLGGDYFGLAVAVDGDTAVVGAQGVNEGRGAVYVFKRTGNSWAKTAKLIASDGTPEDFLGNSVAIEGDTIVAAATFAGVGELLPGAVYTFSRTGAAERTETAKLTASDGGGFLGNSVGIDGDTIVAGAVYAPGGGAVYTFTRTGAAARTETARLTASDAEEGDALGNGVAIEGNTIVAGAPGDNFDNGPYQGSLYTFARTGSAARTETAKLIASDGAPGDQLGNFVAIDGNTIVTGAPADDTTTGEGAGQGSVYTFARTGAAARAETAKLTVSESHDNANLGYAVALDGGTIVASAAGDTVDGVRRGSVYTFARTGAAARNETARLTDPSGGAGYGYGLDSEGGDGYGFGLSVGISGDTIVAGGPYEDIGVGDAAQVDQGSVSMFFEPPRPPVIGGQPVTPVTPPVPAAAPGRPLVSGFDFSPNVIAILGQATPVSAVGKGGRFTYTLSVAAAVKIVIEQRLSGRRRGGRCVSPRRGLKRKCSRYQRRGTLSRSGNSGQNTVPFSGRIGSRALPVGSYRARISAANAAGTSETRTTTFRVVRGKRRR